MNYFKNAEFFTTVNHLQDLSDTPAKIVFVRHNNAGKPSTINTLAQHTCLAYISKTPGHIQHTNFFELKNGGFMTDLPGCGYARVLGVIHTHWIRLFGEYLQRRSQLVELILVMDAHHPLKGLNICMLDFFRTAGRPVHTLPSRADKLSKGKQIKALVSINKSLGPYKECQRVNVQLFSGLKKQGTEEANRIIDE